MWIAKALNGVTYLCRHVVETDGRIGVHIEPLDNAPLKASKMAAMSS